MKLLFPKRKILHFGKLLSIFLYVLFPFPSRNKGRLTIEGQIADKLPGFLLYTAAFLGY